jgi:hypothetical protein
MAAKKGKDAIGTLMVEIDKLIQPLIAYGDKDGVTASQLEKALKKGQLATVSFDLLEKLVAAYDVLGKVQGDLAALKKEKTSDNQALIDEVKNNTLAINRLSEEVTNQGVKYSEVARTGLMRKGVVIPSIKQRKPERAGCVRVVTKPLDVDIKSSRDIRSAFNKKYPDVVIESCYATSGGSFYLEVESKEKAEALDNSWDKDLFGGNSGLRDASVDNQIGVIKNVECHGLTEANIEGSIRTSLQLKEGTQVEFFKRKNRSGILEFTGTIKVVFQDTESLQQAVRDKVKIGDQRCSVAKWEHTVKVRHCYKCLKFGHVAYRCRSATTKCGICNMSGHEQRDCTVTDPKLFKCEHCKKRHVTGSFSCLKMKEQAEKLNSRL